MLRENSHTNRGNIGAHFSPGETFITSGAQEAHDIAGETAIQFLRRHMSAGWAKSPKTMRTRTNFHSEKVVLTISTS